LTRRASVRDESGRTGRDARAVESFKSAAEAIGPITPGLRVFLLTRGQFSFLDMVLYILRELGGPASLSIWTWVIAYHDVQALAALLALRDVTAARLVVDWSAERTGREGVIHFWRDRYGADAVRVCKNHAKLARIWTADRHVLVRGSMNFNFNPRFEQADITEGGPEFDLVAGIEEALPVLRPRASRMEAEAASGISKAFERSQLEVFQGVREFTGLKVWAK